MATVKNVALQNTSNGQQQIIYCLQNESQAEVGKPKHYRVVRR